MSLPQLRLDFRRRVGVLILPTGVVFLSQEMSSHSTSGLLNRAPVAAFQCFALVLMVLLAVAGSVAQARDPGYVGSLAAPEAEVLNALKLIVNDPVIYGTYSYEKEKQLKGARPADSSNAFADPPDEGRVFFKVAENVLAPRHFKETADLGTVSVRYVVQATGANTTAIRIDAVYVEKNRRRPHQSDGTVEESEFKAIQDLVQKAQAEQDDSRRIVEKQASASRVPAAPETTPLVAGSVSSNSDLEKRVTDLKHKVEIRTIAGGAALKSAPFRTAATLRPLPSETELLVVVVTKYWYGVETTDGQKGWVHHSQVEPLP
jgi:hypothetical protein